jgi:hypothetical protein
VITSTTITDDEALWLLSVNVNAHCNVGLDEDGNTIGGTVQWDGRDIWSSGVDWDFSSPLAPNQILVTVNSGHPELGPVGPNGENYSGWLRMDFDLDMRAIGFGTHLLGAVTVKLYRANGSLISSTAWDASTTGFTGIIENEGFRTVVLETNEDFWDSDGGPSTPDDMRGETLREGNCLKFDDIPTPNEPWDLVPGAYQGHCWSDGCTAGGRWVAMESQYIRDVYSSILHDMSSPNIAFNGWGDIDCVTEFAEVISINSCQITRWPNVPGQDATEVRFIGYRGGFVIFDFIVPTQNEVWSPVDFGGAAIDTLVVTPPEGPLHWWLMDDLCVDVCNDATPPDADITSPGDFACGCDPVDIVGTANDPDGGFDSYTVEYRRSGDPNWTVITTSPNPVVNGTLATWNNGGLPEGWYLLRLTVRNACGSVSTDASIVRVSEHFDDLEVRSPQDGGVYGGIVCWDGTAWDNSCFDFYTVEYQIGGNWFPVDPGNPVYTSTVINDPLARWDTIGLGIPDGDYWTLTSAYDDCGHSDMDRRMVTIDNTSPIAVISSPVNCDELDGVIQIIGTADDDHLSSWVLQYTGGNANGWVTIASGNSPINGVLANCDTSGLPDCAYTLRLRASDSAVLNCNGAIHHHSEYLVSLTVGAESGCVGDLDGDGSTGHSDLGILLADWGCSSEP